MGTLSVYCPVESMTVKGHVGPFCLQAGSTYDSGSVLHPIPPSQLLPSSYTPTGLHLSTH